MRLPARLLVLGLVLQACATPHAAVEPAPASTAVTFTEVSATLEPDPELAAMVAPYAEELVERTSEVVGYAEGEIREGRPEGPLGTFAAEAMLSQARKLSDRPVDMALTNNGGLRVPLGPGAITVGKMFELMPFENMMIILDLSAADVDSLAHQLARVGGDPIAGFSFVITPDGRATDVRVSDEPLSPERTYRLVTSDYLANGGGPYEVLWGEQSRQELTFLLRDAFTEHLREIETIRPRVDGLIRREQ